MSDLTVTNRTANNLPGMGMGAPPQKKKVSAFILYI